MRLDPIAESVCHGSGSDDASPCGDPAADVAIVGRAEANRQQACHGK